MAYWFFLGRAGRFGSKFPDGEVTCMNVKDLPLLHSSLKSPSPVLERAGLFPTFDLLFMHSRFHPTKSLYQMLVSHFFKQMCNCSASVQGYLEWFMKDCLDRITKSVILTTDLGYEHFVDNAKLSSNYFIADCEEMLKVAAIVDELPLGLHDKYLFVISPVDMNNDISSQGLIQFAQTYAKKGIVRLREIFTPGTLQVPKSHSALKELESIYQVLDLYVWLSFRLEDSFLDRELALSQRAICSMLIEGFLERGGWRQPMASSVPSRISSTSLLSQSNKQDL
ncbi:ATP-dependent RNA helicase SUV3, mitochondrial [Vitis vinifera]|uniref:ATP-dependent RNA helicase SUV3, mitochondrial n=1 Tax=Vitis vinifera TaxID=29760 RepID=A0A438KMD9_VITVI|nr:ATP-dependent RNA helicase SUV3, mitochondrial [Vitis vinifera]